MKSAFTGSFQAKKSITDISTQFLLDNKLNGKLAIVAKNSKRDKLVDAYEKLFETKSFRCV